MPGVFRNPRTLSAKIRNITDTSKLVLEFIFKQFSSPMPLFTKLATLLLESSSVADPVPMDPHHFGKKDQQQKQKQDPEPHQSQKADPDLRSVCK
jgi:hypothetical protein